MGDFHRTVIIIIPNRDQWSTFALPFVFIPLFSALVIQISVNAVRLQAIINF